MKISSCTEWLFFHLWRKNPITGFTCPGIVIPDTIIYRWAKPFFWYFTTNEGEIKRRTKERVFVEKFEAEFQKQSNEAITGNEMLAVNITSMAIEGNVTKNDPEKIEFEYLNKKGFKDFLYQRQKQLNGILQRFVDAKGKKNSMIKVSWSPQFCMLSRKTNVHDLNNQKVSILDRIATFEGPEYLSNTDSISSPFLSSDIEQLCINIVRHIQDVSGGNIQISRMVLYFKLDCKNRLQLMFCTGLKVREKFVSGDEMNLQMKSPEVQLEQSSPILKMHKQTKWDTATTNHHNKVKIHNNFVEKMKYENEHVCANCQDQCKYLYKIQFRYIIQAYDQKIYDEESLKIFKQIEQDEQDKHKPQKIKPKEQKKPDSYEFFKLLEEDESDFYNEKYKNIPGVIMKVWGRMTEEQYYKYKTNKSWLDLCTKVCDKCYLRFTLPEVQSIDERIALKNQSAMKNDCHPQENDFTAIRHVKQSLIDQNALKQMLNKDIQEQKHGSKTQTNRIFRDAPTAQKNDFKDSLSDVNKINESDENKLLMNNNNKDDLKKNRSTSNMTSTIVNSKEITAIEQGNKESRSISLKQDVSDFNQNIETHQHYQVFRQNKIKKRNHSMKFDPAPIYKDMQNITLPKLKCTSSHLNSSNASTNTTISMTARSTIIQSTIKDVKNMLKALDI